MISPYMAGCPNSYIYTPPSPERIAAAKAACEKIADGAKWTGDKVADCAKWVSDQIKEENAGKLAIAELAVNCCMNGVQEGAVKTIKENEYARNIANGVVNFAIANGDSKIFGWEIGQSILGLGVNFAPNEYQGYAEKLVPFAQTPEGRQALLLASNTVFAYLGKEQDKLKATSETAQIFFTTQEGQKVGRRLGEDFKNDVPKILSQVAKEKGVQDAVRGEWSKLPQDQKEKMEFALAKIGVDINNLTPDKLTEENIAKIYNKVFPTIQAAFNKFVSSKNDFADISTLDPENTTLVKAAYIATDRAKCGLTLDNSFEQLLYEKEDKTKNGFEVFVQRSKDKGKIIISYRDTNEKMDLISDAQLAGNQKPEQLENALNVYKKMRETYPTDEIIITGHSLGGSLTELVCSSPEARKHGKTRGFVFNSYGAKDNLKACGEGYQDNGNVIGAVCKSDYFVAKSANHVGKTYSVNSEKYADIPQKVVEQATRKYVDIAIGDWSFENANAQLGELVKNEATKYKDAHQLDALADVLKIGG